MNYYLESLHRGRWHEMSDGATYETVVKTESEAFEMLLKWERYRPTMSFRWVKR
jgi:hypothetical protein